LADPVKKFLKLKFENFFLACVVIDGAAVAASSLSSAMERSFATPFNSSFLEEPQIVAKKNVYNCTNKYGLVRTGSVGLDKDVPATAIDSLDHFGWILFGKLDGCWGGKAKL
jgi:hypothetical protein